MGSKNQTWNNQAELEGFGYGDIVEQNGARGHAPHTDLIIFSALSYS